MVKKLDQMPNVEIKGLHQFKMLQDKFFSKILKYKLEKKKEKKEKKKDD